MGVKMIPKREDTSSENFRRAQNLKAEDTNVKGRSQRFEMIDANCTFRPSTNRLPFRRCLFVAMIKS
jgi:hypothetical protein